MCLDLLQRNHKLEYEKEKLKKTADKFHNEIKEERDKLMDEIIQVQATMTQKNENL